MLIECRGNRPRVHETAYVAPNAVLSGDVTVGANTSVLFGAVLTADGGPVTVGDGCVVMENAVLRGTPKHPLVLGNDVLVGPGAHLSGCTIEDGAFLATRATVFNGAVIGAGSEVRISGVVHVNSMLAPGSLVPIGWIAVGDPAQLFPPSKHDELWPIQKAMEFSRTVFGRERETPQHEKIRIYAKALTRHRNDRVLE